MKLNIKIIYLITVLTFTLTHSTVTGQDYVNTPVEISKDRVKINGMVCYSHVVLERQTLYSISKAYEVSVEDIYLFNPTLKEEGLKKNSIIIIPSKEALAASRKPENIENTKTTESENVISQNTSTVKVDKKVHTQKTTSSTSKTEPAKRIHIAKWYEDLDVIASQYGVSVEDIMKANNLKGRKLSKRQKLVIPYAGEVIAESTPESTEVVSEEIVIVQKDTVKVKDKIKTQAQPKTEVNATIILPLTDSDGKPNRNNMDFYCGSLLAVYDLAQQGIDCNLNVYDIMNSETRFSVESLQESDVVIGPVSAADLTRMFNIVSNPKAIVSPLDPRAERLLYEHPEMIQAPTPHVIQYHNLVSWIEEDIKEGDRVVMITEKGARQSGIYSQMKAAIDSSSLSYSPFSYSILEGRDVTEALTGLMTMEGANRILVASESEAFVNDVVRNLNLLIYNNLDIILYAPSKIRGFETIEVDNLHNTSMHVSLGYYIDYEDSKVKGFLKKYRALYNTEPSQFAFQGYDLAMYFLDLCSRYGDNWKDHLSEAPADMLQSSFNFSKAATGGYTNNGVRRIVYGNGYDIKKVK